MKSIGAFVVALAAVLAVASFPGYGRQEEKKQEETKQESKKQESKKEEKKPSKNPLEWAKRPFMEERKREVDVRGEFKKLKDGSRFIYTTMSGIQVSITVKNGVVTDWVSQYRGRSLPLGFQKTEKGDCWVITPNNMANEDLWLQVPCETIEGRLAKPKAQE